MLAVPGVAAVRIDAGPNGALRCDVVPAEPGPALARYLAACSAPAQLWSLPDGAPVVGINGHELAYMVWEQQSCDTYRLGALERPDAVVVDAGANIGLFSLYAAARSRATRVVSIEPVPALVDVLRRNVELHGFGDQVTTAATAVGAQAEATSIRFAPFFAALSSRHRAERAVICRRLVLAIKVLFPRLARDAGVDLDLAKAWITSQLQEIDLSVPVVTLSEIVREHGLERIDLLKIDVEGSELAVLQGIDERDWGRIDRVALEVNDVDGRVRAVEDLLSDRGLHVSTEDDPSASRVVPSRIAIVHGSRAPLGPRAGDAPLPRLDAEASFLREAGPVLSAVEEVLRGTPVEQVRLRRVLADPEPPPGLPARPVLEAVSTHLAGLLGVPPLKLAPGWDPSDTVWGPGPG